jgi:hypothetical protein
VTRQFHLVVSDGVGEAVGPEGQRVVVELNYVEERSQRGVSVYGHTCRRKLEDGQEVEVRAQAGMAVES